MKKKIYILSYIVMGIVFFHGCKPHKEETNLTNQYVMPTNQHTPLKDSSILITSKLTEVESTFSLENLNNNKIPAEPIPQGYENAAIFNDNKPDVLNSFPYIVLKSKDSTHSFQLIKTYINTHFIENGVNKSPILSMSIAYIPIRASKINDMSDIWNSLNFNKICSEHVHEDIYSYLKEYIKRKKSNFFINDNITINLTDKLVDYSKMLVRSIAPIHDVANKRALISWDDWYKNDDEFKYIETLNLSDYTPTNEENIHVLFYMNIQFMNEGKRLYLNVPMNYSNMNLLRGVYHDTNRTSFIYELAQE